MLCLGTVLEHEYVCSRTVPKKFVIRCFVVAVAQLVEHLTVAQVVAGSNPVSHPNKFSLLVGRERQIVMINHNDHGYFYVLGCQRLRALFSDDVIVSNHPVFSVS